MLFLSNLIGKKLNCQSDGQLCQSHFCCSLQIVNWIIKIRQNFRIWGILKMSGSLKLSVPNNGCTHAPSAVNHLEIFQIPKNWRICRRLCCYFFWRLKAGLHFYCLMGIHRLPNSIGLQWPVVVHFPIQFGIFNESKVQL